MTPSRSLPVLGLALACIASCGGGEGTSPDAAGPGDAAGSGDGATDADDGPATLQVHFLYVHGLKNCEDARMNAERSLTDLEDAVNAALAPRIAEYEAQNPGVTVVTSSGRANIDTA